MGDGAGVPVGVALGNTVGGGVGEHPRKSAVSRPTASGFISVPSRVLRMRTLSDGDDIATEGPGDQPGMLAKPLAM